MPDTSSWPLACCIPVIEAMSAPMSASTTRRKIAAIRLKPLSVLGRIVHVYLLKKPHRFAAARDLHRKADDAGARTDGGVGEAAARDVVCQQRVVRRYRRRGLRGGNAVVPVAAQLAAGRVAFVSHRVLHDVEALARRRIGELERWREHDLGTRDVRVRGAVIAA